ncbi:uncharacterized protein LOC124819523, partial [Vigna umbellata]|uniref:uncharacterized protein LOC124819523 n=1 Tax=Vigna umbellata TaxID=87088 RepID=UPI001F5F22C8
MDVDKLYRTVIGREFNEDFCQYFLLVVKSKKLQFDLEQVGVQYMGITSTPPCTTSLSLTIRLLFSATNPNKVITTIVVDRVNLLQVDAVDLIRDASLNDRVDLRVLGDVSTKIDIMKSNSPSVQAILFAATIF